MSCPVPLPLPLHAPAALHADYPPVHIGVKVRTRNHNNNWWWKYVTRYIDLVRFDHARILCVYLQRVRFIQLSSTNEIMCPIESFCVHLVCIRLHLFLYRWCWHTFSLRVVQEDIFFFFLYSINWLTYINHWMFPIRIDTERNVCICHQSTNSS